MKLRNPATLCLCSPPCPSLVLRFTVVPQGRVCPLKHCHTAIVVPSGLRDPAYDVAYQSKMQGKVRGVSSRQSLRCQVWNNALITPELQETTSPWPSPSVQPGLCHSCHPSHFPTETSPFSPLIKLKTLPAQADLSNLLDLSTRLVAKHCGFPITLSRWSPLLPLQKKMMAQFSVLYKHGKRRLRGPTAMAVMLR